MVIDCAGLVRAMILMTALQMLTSEAFSMTSRDNTRKCL